MDLAAAASIVHHALGQAHRDGDLRHLVTGLRTLLVGQGVAVDRIQLPFSRAFGFRHPTLGLLLVTWSDAEQWAGSEELEHSAFDQLLTNESAKSPYASLARGAQAHHLLDLAVDELTLPIWRMLRDKGYRGYFAFGVPMPDGTIQPMSLASRAPYPPDIADRVAPLVHVLALALYGAYRTSQAERVAQAYIGRACGRRVLDGEIRRGSTEFLDAGIMFCDIRNFTQLSEQLGAVGVVAEVNRIFAIVGQHAEARGGEILKFIGDAMLVVFAVQDGDASAVADAMVQTACAALAAVTSLPGGTQIGFGCHLGQVVQGNIGTPTRLDYTVMGPAVNLASRLESLCKVLGADAVFSASVAEAATLPLHAAGQHPVKGVAEPVAAFVLPPQER
jgi:adenylate cyclase